MHRRHKQIAWLVTTISTVGLFLCLACAREVEAPVSTGPSQSHALQAKKKRADAPKVLPTMALSAWPDLARPGETVTITCSGIDDEQALSLRFFLRTDPCGGTLEALRNQALYKAPEGCRGGRIVVEAVSGAASAQASFHVSGDGSDVGSLMLYPKAGDIPTSPVQLHWDRTFARKDSLTMSVDVLRQGRPVLALPGLAPDAELQLDLPPSPELTTMRVCAGGTCQSAELKVFKRRPVQLWDAGLLLDDFAVVGKNRLGGAVEPLDPESFTRLVQGKVVGPTSITAYYLAVEYHRSPAQKSQGFRETLSRGNGFPLETTGFRRLSLWLRPGPLNEMPGPIVLELKAPSGQTWRRKITHRGDWWQEHSIDLAPFNQRYSRAVALSLFVDDERTTLPAGTFCVASVQFIPAGASLIDRVDPSLLPPTPEIEATPDRDTTDSDQTQASSASQRSRWEEAEGSDAR
jgi:hypothetical protein